MRLKENVAKRMNEEKKMQAKNNKKKDQQTSKHHTNGKHITLSLMHARTHTRQTNV